MTRLSSDELRDGHVFNGYDYSIQVWVVDGIIRRCGHPAAMRSAGLSCCNASRYADQRISEVPGAETFPPDMTQRA